MKTKAPDRVEVDPSFARLVQFRITELERRIEALESANTPTLRIDGKAAESLAAHLPSPERGGSHLIPSADFTALSEKVRHLEALLSDTMMRVNGLVASAPKPADAPAPERAADEPVAPEGYEFCTRDEAERGKGGGYWAFYRVDASTWSGPGWRTGTDHDSEYRFLRKRTTPALPPEIVVAGWMRADGWDDAQPMGTVDDDTELVRAGLDPYAHHKCVGLFIEGAENIIWLKLTPRTEPQENER